MQNSAQFLIEGWFNITKRGLVITGQITSGEISKGDYIFLGDDLVKIKSVEIGNVAPNAFFIGLILDIKNQSEMLPVLNKIKGENLLVLTTRIANQPITS